MSNIDLEIEDAEIDFSQEEIFEDDSIQGFLSPQESIYSVDTKNGLVCCGCGDDCGYVWDITDGEMKLKLESFSDSVVCSRFSYNGEYCAFGSLDGTVKVIHTDSVSNPVSDQSIISLEGASEVNEICWHPNINILAVGSEDGNIWIWEIPSGNLLQVFSSHSERINDLVFSIDGKLLFSASEDGTFVSWNIDALMKGTSVSSGDYWITKYPNSKFNGCSLLCVGSLKDSSHAFIGSADGSTYLISTLGVKILANYRGIHTEPIEGILFHETLKILITCSLDGKICFWDMGSGNVRTCKTLSSEENPVGITCIKWMDETSFVSGSTDGIVRVWDCRSGDILRELKGHQDIILDLIISEDKKIISCSDDCNCLVFQ